MAALQHNRLRWYGHMLQKDDSGCSKKHIAFVVESTSPRCRHTRTWMEGGCEKFEDK